MYLLKELLIKMLKANYCFIKKVESRTQFAFVYPRSVQIKVNESSRFFMNIKEKATKTDEIIREDVVISFSSFSRWPPYLEEIDIKRVVIPALW